MKFTPEHAADYVQEARKRVVEDKARADASQGVYLPPCHNASTYAGEVGEAMEGVLYREAWAKRVERMRRQAVTAQP